MRNISFMLTVEQIKSRQKRVTRRMKWLNVKPGDLLQGCVKCQGRKAGEPLEKLAIVRVVSVRREPLNKMLVHPYGAQEAILEGFPTLGGSGFVSMFCEHMNCKPDAEVTRIEFEYV